MPELSGDGSGWLEVLSKLRAAPADLILDSSRYSGRLRVGSELLQPRQCARAHSRYQGRGNSMTMPMARRAAFALIAGGVLATAGGSAALAQDNLGSVVTIGGGISGVAGGTTIIMAPGVTIDGGDVGNSTDIGVLSGGGSSIGASTGGSDSVAASE